MNDITYVGKHPLIVNVSRHVHESWEYVYCTYGAGTFTFDNRTVAYKKGDVVVIPPMVPHSNASETGFQNIHINMLEPSHKLKEPTILTDDSNHFLLDAFTAAFFHFYSDRKERTALLAAYGNLISCYLSAYQTGLPRSGVVEEIELTIINSYADADFKLDAYLKSLPFSYDYLRKLFQKELGVTPHQYLNDKRLQIAAELLVNTASDATAVADIARMCGFREPLYFSRMFKKKYGVAPSYYYRSRRSAEDQARKDPTSVKKML
ncbi:MAG: AraC family transcriptional regulator [Clostridia bacterium]|nr:AraC family transcriptional regulator [Clostridia bacterium]